MRIANHAYRDCCDTCRRSKTSRARRCPCRARARRCRDLRASHATVSPDSARACGPHAHCHSPRSRAPSGEHASHACDLVTSCASRSNVPLIGALLSIHPNQTIANEIDKLATKRLLLSVRAFVREFKTLRSEGRRQNDMT